MVGLDFFSDKVNMVKKNLEGTLDKLLSSGWNGASKEDLMNIKYLAFKNELQNSIDKINTNKAYLELCREEVYDIEAEEDRLFRKNFCK